MPVRGLFEPLGRYIFAQIPSMTVITIRNNFFVGFLTNHECKSLSEKSWWFIPIPTQWD